MGRWKERERWKDTPDVMKQNKGRKEFSVF
jgi:hypothetical protein